MYKNKIKQSLILKIICIITVPILIVMMIASGLTIMYTVETPEVKTEKDFYKTDIFSNNYEVKIEKCARYIDILRKIKENNNGEEEKKQSIKTVYVDDEIIYYNVASDYIEEGFEYLIIDENQKIAYTNIKQTSKTDKIQKIKDYILKRDKNWLLEENRIQTSIEKLSDENIKYNYIYEEIKDILKGGSIYTAFNYEEKNNSYIEQKTIYDIVNKNYKSAYIIFPIVLFLTMFMIIYLIASCGYIPKEKDVYLNWFDKIPLEIISVISILIISIETVIVAGAYSLYELDITLCLYSFGISLYILLLTGIYMCGTYIKRIKNKSLLKNSITYKIYKYVKNKIGNIYKNIVYNPNNTLKIALIYGSFIIISIILCISTSSIIGLILLLAFWISAFLLLLKFMKQFRRH